MPSVAHTTEQGRKQQTMKSHKVSKLTAGIATGCEYMILDTLPVLSYQFSRKGTGEYECFYSEVLYQASSNFGFLGVLGSQTSAC